MKISIRALAVAAVCALVAGTASAQTTSDDASRPATTTAAGDTGLWYVPTAETLDKYIADPQAFIPANRMPYAGISNAADRADLIAYLQKATQ